MNCISIEEEQNKKIRALLVGKPHSDISELEGLVDTLGLEIARSVLLARMELSPVYGIGSGKAEELSALAHEISADVIIFDFELEPRKQRNWEKLAQIPVFDRHEVILRIFAQRAQTKEAVLQVELARLEYSLPRLAHSYGDMARQRGGNFGAKGSGETQLELDTRTVREKIAQVKNKLARVERDRETQRKKRIKGFVPSCALAGYTNAGKSSLLNALTGADVLVEDKLFATLDPTTRKIQIKGISEESGYGTDILLTDTVGFISNLPHSLVNAFKSTLDEVRQAELILLVLDASDTNAEQQYSTVVSVLEEIHAEKIPRIVILNKIDKLSESDPNLAHLEALFPDAVKLSTKTKAGFGELARRIQAEILGAEKKYIIPTENQEMLAVVRRSGIILAEEWLDDGVHITIKGGEALKNSAAAELLRRFEAEPENGGAESERDAGDFKKKFGSDW